MTTTKRPTARERASLELLFRISQELAAQLDLRRLLQRTLQLTLETIDAPSGSILVLDEGGRVTEGALAYGGKVHDHTADQLADTREGLAGGRDRQALLPAPATQPLLKENEGPGDRFSRACPGRPGVVVLTLVSAGR
jgi:GAF domain-containing protein